MYVDGDRLRRSLKCRKSHVDPKSGEMRRQRSRNKPRFFCTFILLFLSLQLFQSACGRTWRDIDILHNSTTLGYETLPGDPFEKDPFSSTVPSSSSSSNIFERETTPPPTRDISGTRPPSAVFTSPTEAPVPQPDYPLHVFPESSETPRQPPKWYFNYDTSTEESSLYGPGFPVMEYTKENGFTVSYANNGWANDALEFPPPPNYYWDEFGPQGTGAWKDTLTDRQLRINQCGNVGRQSPIDIRLTGVACVEHHQIRTMPGDFRVTGAAIQKQILPSKLRLLYQRRPCADFVNNPICSEPDPPHADFPNGWGGFSDMMHVDFKFPSEHRIYGQSFDGEMQIYHLHPGRRRLPVISVMINAARSSNPDHGHNEYLQEAIDEFQYEHDSNMAHCSSTVASVVERNGQTRRLENDSRYSPNAGFLFNETIDSFDNFYNQLSRMADGSDSSFVQAESQRRRRLSRIWHPYHESLMPSYYFFGYDGSLTEPPCTEIVSWFVMDAPMTISELQLNQMKSILFTNVDKSTCTSTSVHYQNSVARPIQETGDRQVWRCTRDDFIPDHERQN